MSEPVYHAQLFQAGTVQAVEDCLAKEEALQISVNGEPFTITMRSPGNEEELARGLLFTEGLYREESRTPGYEISSRTTEGIITSINMRIPEHYLLRSFGGERNIASTSSCGLCGKTSLEPGAYSVEERNFRIAPEKVMHFFETMRMQQMEFGRSGGTHAAALFNQYGELLVVREDIGRHNAVDKVIGAMLMKGNLKHAACLAVSGRISYEIVSKALSANIAILASVSAPSSLAIDTAMKYGLTLLAFCRGNKFTVYTHPERINTTQSIKQA
jgi:FdhD protein